MQTQTHTQHKPRRPHALFCHLLLCSCTFVCACLCLYVVCSFVNFSGFYVCVCVCVVVASLCVGVFLACVCAPQASSHTCQKHNKRWYKSHWHKSDYNSQQMVQCGVRHLLFSFRHFFQMKASVVVIRYTTVTYMIQIHHLIFIIRSNCVLSSRESDGDPHK